MSAAACTRARSPLAVRARPPLRLMRSLAPARAPWRTTDPGAAHGRARLLPACSAEQA
jgi:hypothetical protein